MTNLPEAHRHHAHGRPEAHPGHGAPDAHAGHGAGGAHAGHTPEMFRNRFFVSLLLTLPILYLSEELEMWLGFEAVAFPGAAWGVPALATVVYLYGGGVFVVGAWRELVARRPGMMTLVAMAITTAYAYSLAVTLGLPGMSFYWELATLVDVMLLGHWIEMASVQGAGRALEHLASLVPAVAHRLSGDTVEDVPVDDLREGDLVLVRPGEQVPVDGIVVEGASSLNEAFLTGESRPVLKEPGGEVVAGSVNGEGALRVRVARTGEWTTLSQIVRLVREAQASRSRFQALADRAAAWLTLIAIAAGAVTFAAWLLTGGGPTAAVTRAVTVLVIACPHALGLAIPLVVANATGISAKHGILVRNREAFERARDLQVVAFDKTGTLTTGSFGVQAVATAGLAAEDALALAAGLEAMSEHPLARAVVDEAARRGVATRPAGDVRAVPGRGLEGTVDGRPYRIGRPEWAGELDADIPPALAAALEEADRRGESAVLLFEDRRPVAVFALADRVRESAREAVRHLRAAGLEVVMVTGDAEAVARTVAAEVGVARYFARVLPQDKARIVEELKAGGRRVAFVGDGINDAPALVEADLGVAIGAGTNVAIESADLVLVEDDPGDVARALALSRATYRKMVQNLFWATGYNAVAIPLAAGAAAAWGILLSPALGAVFMSASTVIVALNAALLRRVRLG